MLTLPSFCLKQHSAMQPSPYTAVWPVGLQPTRRMHSLPCALLNLSSPAQLSRHLLYGCWEGACKALELKALTDIASRLDTVLECRHLRNANVDHCRQRQRTLSALRRLELSV